MKRTFLLMVACLAMVEAYSQTTMRQLWIDMPDSLVEYLNTTKRTEMVDFYDMGVKAETANLLMGATVLDSITESYADISLNECARMQLALLKASNGDSILCMVRTFMGEAPESVVSFYDTKWGKRDEKEFLSIVEPSLLVNKPDTMDVERYEQLVKLVDPIMVQAVFLPEDQSLEFSLSTPLLTLKEKESLNAIFVQRKLKWNGRIFN